MHRKSAETTFAGRGQILRWLTPFLGPNQDPKTGPKQRHQRRNENVIQFWTPFWGPDLDPKMGSGLDPKMRPAIGEFCHGRQMLSPLMCDALRMSMTANTCFFPLGPTVLRVQWRSLYGRYVSLSFLDPVLGVMMKQVFRQTFKSLAAVGCRCGGEKHAVIFLMCPTCVHLF